MINKHELISQAKLAFEFVQKLYFEVSYLIKEVEGVLSEEPEEFIFGRPFGYAVTSRSSNGLDSFQVNLWMYRKLAVFFVPKKDAKLSKGQTFTSFETNPKIFYLRIVLDDKDHTQPTVYFGILKDFQKKRKSRIEKIESLMATIEYNENKVFTDIENINYEDTNVAFKGKLICIDLFDVNSSEDVYAKIIQPGLALFRENIE